MKNLLILSVGTRNKVVEYFMKYYTDENGNKLGNIVVTDASNLAPALYIADKYFIIPKLYEKGYFEIVLDICKKESISGILSFIDPELNELARNKEKLNNLGVTLIGSDLHQCDLSLDKMKMFKWLKEHNYNVAKTYTELKDFYKDLENKVIDFPIFVKPQEGSASISINKVYEKETLELLFKSSDNLIIQEFLDGQEIGADVYIDLISKKVVSIFTKKKLKMRAGETDKAVSFKDPKLFELIEDFVNKFGYTGQIDIDIFEINGKYYISEVNPRFGGGYPHAFESGCDHIKLIANNMQNIENKASIGNYEEEIYMMKYNEIMVI